jgi:hypothetical protein
LAARLATAATAESMRDAGIGRAEVESGNAGLDQGTGNECYLFVAHDLLTAHVDLDGSGKGRDDVGRATGRSGCDLERHRLERGPGGQI